jgi:hypothetical protein
MPPSRITLQYLVVPHGRGSVPAYDAQFAGTNISLPPSILLDYMYGVAAYKRWGGGQVINRAMQQRFAEHYQNIPIPPASPPSSSDDGSENDDPNDPDYQRNTRPRGRYHRSKMSDGMLRAMDDVLLLSRLLKGQSPQSIAAEQQRQEEAADLRAMEASRAKVQQWMQQQADGSKTVAGRDRSS